MCAGLVSPQEETNSKPLKSALKKATGYSRSSNPPDLHDSGGGGGGDLIVETRHVRLASRGFFEVKL